MVDLRFICKVNYFQYHSARSIFFSNNTNKRVALQLLIVTGKLSQFISEQTQSNASDAVWENTTRVYLAFNVPSSSSFA